MPGRAVTGSGRRPDRMRSTGAWLASSRVMCTTSFISASASTSPARIWPNSQSARDCRRRRSVKSISPQRASPARLRSCGVASNCDRRSAQSRRIDGGTAQNASCRQVAMPDSSSNSAAARLATAPLPCSPSIRSPSETNLSASSRACFQPRVASAARSMRVLAVRACCTACTRRPCRPAMAAGTPLAGVSAGWAASLSAWSWLRSCALCRALMSRSLRSRRSSSAGAWANQRAGASRTVASSSRSASGASCRACRQLGTAGASRPGSRLRWAVGRIDSASRGRW